MDKIKLIQAQRYFKDLPEHHLQALASCSEYVDWSEKETVFQIGETSKQFYLIVSGSVELLMPSENKGSVCISTLHEGDLLGWSWLFPPHKWHFDAQTKTESRALAFNVEAFTLLCESEPELSAAMYKRFSRIVVERLQATRLQLLEVSSDR